MTWLFAGAMLVLLSVAVLFQLGQRRDARARKLARWFSARPESAGCAIVGIDCKRRRLVVRDRETGSERHVQAPVSDVF